MLHQKSFMKCNNLDIKCNWNITVRAVRYIIRYDSCVCCCTVHFVE